VFSLRMLEAVCDQQAPSPQLVPGSTGDLQIEWHTLNGDIELHVRAPNDVYAWCSITDGSAGEVEIRLSNDFSIVAGWVKTITGAPHVHQAAAA